MDGEMRGIRHPYPEPPETGAATEIAEDILWLRIPLPMALDHVNVYALRDDDGWTIVDTGLGTGKTRAIWQDILAGPLRGAPVRRVLVSHHHPDHVGLAGWFQGQGADLLTTRTAWLLARMLVLDVEQRATPQALAFYRSAGMDPALLERRRTDRPFNFADVVAPMPKHFTRIIDGAVLRLGGRDWVVRTGDGHAPEQATLWERSGTLVLGADQLLPGISANIGVYPTEPDADPLAEWIASCRRFATIAQEDHLVLPGHKLPYTGLPLRLRQMVENHETALDRLLDLLVEPRVATACFPALYKRTIDEGTYGLALVEAVAHLNHLLARGAVTRIPGPDGAWLWRRV